MQRWVVSPCPAGDSRAGETRETMGASSRDLATPWIPAAAQLLQHETRGGQEQLCSSPRNDGELGQMSQRASLCRVLQKSKLRQNDSDTPRAESVGLVHVQFFGGIDRMVFNCSTWKAPSILPFWNTLF